MAEQCGRPQVRVPGEDGHRQRGRYPAERVEQLQAGHAGHVHVGEDQVEVLGRGQPERDRGVRGVRDLELPPLGQDIDGEQRGLGVVLDHQDPGRARAS